MADLTRAIAEALGEALPGYSIRGRGATSAEIAAALVPLIVQREQQAFDRGYDKAMESIEARVREAQTEAWDEGWQAAQKVVDFEGEKVWTHQVLSSGDVNHYREKVRRG